MKWLKVIVSIIVLLVLVAVVAIVSLIIFIDPNKMKPILATEVMKQTGYQLTMDGPLTWSFYPRLGIKIEHMTLKAPGQASPFLELQDIRMAADLPQLLHGIEKLQGDVAIATVRFMNVQLQNAHINLHWENQQLTLQPITASLYQGSLTGMAQGRGLTGVPMWDVNVQLDHVQLQPLLRDANGPDSKLSISGVAQVKLQAQTQGKERNQLISHLNGHSEFNLQNGAVEGVDLNYLIQSALAYIDKQPVTLTDTHQTAFTSLTGWANIKNGVAETNNALLVAPAFTTKAQGSINLLAQTLHFQLQTKPLQAVTIKGNKVELEIPVIVSGSLQQPDVKLDTTELQKYAVKQEIQRFKEKAREEIKEHIPGKAGEFLQNLLGK